MRSDGELVNAVADGDKAAFEELVVRYERAVRAVCVNILNDRHFAADAAQEAFVSAYRKMGTLRDCKTFAPWLMQIAKRCSLDMVRNRRDEAQLVHDATTAIQEGGSRTAPTGNTLQPSGSNHLLDEEKQILLAAVMRLGDGEREAIMLRYFDGRSARSRNWSSVSEVESARRRASASSRSTALSRASIHSAANDSEACARL